MSLLIVFCTDDIFIKQNNANRALLIPQVLPLTRMFTPLRAVLLETTQAYGKQPLVLQVMVEFNSADGTAATLSSTGELEIFGDLLMQDEKKLYLSTDTSTAPTYLH